MKKILKWMIIVVIYCLVLPFGYTSLLERGIIGSSFFYQFFAQAFALIPGILGMFVRSSYYKQTLKESYIDFDIGFGSIISKMDTCIGRGVFVNAFNIIGLATIGDGVVIANYVSILSGSNQHNFSDPDAKILDGNDTVSRVIIGAGTFIGDKSVIMANVGEKTIIGAGTIVVVSVPGYVLAVGNPARIVKNRRNDNIKN